LKQFLGIGLVFRNSVLALALAAAMGGCALTTIAIPTPEHGEGFSEAQVHEQLASGQFTREDVLLAFGPPLRHMEEDRYFIYRWDRTHWSWVKFIFIYPIPGTSRGFAYAPHYLAMEFNLNGELLRYKYFARWTAPSDDEFFEKIFPEWANEPKTDSR